MQLEQEALTCHAAVAHHGNIAASKRDLERQLDDTIAFSRASVWREQAQYERQRVNANVVTAYEPEVPCLQRPVGQITVLASALVAFAVMLGLDIMSMRNQQNCLAMLVLLTILWCTEVIPLYVTSMLVPALTVLLQVFPDPKKPGHVMPAPDAAKRVFEVLPTPCSRACNPGTFRHLEHVHELHCCAGAQAACW
jgi:phosphate transporter